MAEKREKTPLEVANKVAKGKLQLTTPIQDGEKTYDELKYDMTALTGWELAKALDMGDSMGSSAKNGINDTQALCLFAAAAAKVTEGLDSTDIRERLGAMDAVTAINISTIFFRGSLLAGSMRILSM